MNLTLSLFIAFFFKMLQIIVQIKKEHELTFQRGKKQCPIGNVILVDILSKRSPSLVVIPVLVVNRSALLKMSHVTYLNAD